ncbi:hypothetical protein SCRM01_198 [Synechococcus phage S-CRM01]|uniref:hypothetical protein n=1 Tax=Synechococcus phage S-CRM01 TaxID=1026955 RepID=UPI000209E417|nr:hypothetical protein SCRM01_198 [Synechococcus phage S-CRM01]AEC53144.1 hypothetical protein SCRM01_198 [Synechococcus phage S-CRM01]
MRLTNTEQAQHLTEYFENLPREIQSRLFVVMFNRLQEMEEVNCYVRDDEDDPDYGEFSAYWAHCGEDLKDGLD